MRQLYVQVSGDIKIFLLLATDNYCYLALYFHRYQEEPHQTRHWTGGASGSENTRRKQRLMLHLIQSLQTDTTQGLNTSSPSETLKFQMI